MMLQRTCLQAPCIWPTRRRGRASRRRISARLCGAGALLCGVLLGADAHGQEPVPTPADGYEDHSDLPAPGLSAEQIEHALARFAHEPTLATLQASLRRQRALDPAVAQRLARRARRAGLLPTLRVATRRGQGVDLDERIGELRYSTDDQLTLEASLVWRLDRAAYGPNEVALLREAGRRLRERTARERLLITAYYERRRLQLEMLLLEPAAPEARIAQAIRIRELGALLDSLAGTRLFEQGRASGSDWGG